MARLQRRVGIVILLALLGSVGTLSAQDTSEVTVAGSGIVAPVFEALVSASGTPITLDTAITGTSGGFDLLCQGEADIALANRTINQAESNTCTTNNIEYVEQLVAHDILAFVASTDATYTQCLTSENLNTIFPPSAAQQVTNWNQVDANNGDIPLAVVVSDVTSPSFVALDNLIQGDGIRSDTQMEASDESVIEAVAGNPGAIGVVRLNSIPEGSDQVNVLELNTNAAVGCTVPSTTNVEARSYTAAESLYVYVNSASLDKPGLKDGLRFISSQEASETIDELGLSAPSTTVYATNIAGLEGEGDTAPFSAEETTYQIPFDVAGNVTVGGAVSAQDYLSAVASQFQSQYASVTIDANTEGQPAGVRRLCNGEIDIAVIDSPLTDEQSQNCEANNISTLPIELGTQAVVLVANANTPHLMCLTPEQLATTWRASSGDTIANWNQVDSSFPDLEMTLFQPTLGNSYADILLTDTTGNVIPTREDTEINADPLYRAAATANVEGALTFMSWTEYQSVLANNQERIQLVGIQSGDNCIVPSAENITDGSYPLTRSATLLVNEASLTKPQVQSVLWYIASDENYPLLGQAGLIGVNFGDLPLLRETLQRSYLQAAQTPPEATPEATSEATPEG